MQYYSGSPSFCHPSCAVYVRLYICVTHEVYIENFLFCLFLWLQQGYYFMKYRGEIILTYKRESYAVSCSVASFAMLAVQFAIAGTELLMKSVYSASR